MKKLIYVTTVALAIASFGSAAYAKHGNRSDRYDIEACQHIPPPRPTGGGTRERMVAIERCNEIRSKAQQTPSTSLTGQSNPSSEEQQTPITLPMTQPNPPATAPSPSKRNLSPSSSTQPSVPGQ